MIAALFVETGGCYFGHSDIDPWDKDRDARLYAGPYPVICHPPCQRWGKYWHGSPRKPHQYQMGDDDGCFAHALSAVRRYGGVLEHPKDSHAFDKDFFDITKPKYGQGWIKADNFGGMSCCVDQGHYGHLSRKPTFLYAVGIDFPELIWDPHPQILPKWMIERYGYDKARRSGMISMIGSKNKTKIREATPVKFRNVLIQMAASVMR